jgi:aspartate/methionine/tyrosine aminotransferase
MIIIKYSSPNRERRKPLTPSDSNPNNPTGATIPYAVLADIVCFASQRSITILSDEVFRPLFHTTPAEGAPPSIMSFSGSYSNIIATSSLSKAFSLPGIRLGWAISPNLELIRPITWARDYTTISVSQVDQEIATFALSGPVRDAILHRSLAICAKNLALLESFVAAHADRLRWVKPAGGSAAFVRVLDPNTREPVDDGVYCETLLRETGLLIVPGGVTFGTEAEDDWKGYLRVGFVCEPRRFERALEIWGASLDGV